jgi:hypothetical protein
MPAAKCKDLLYSTAQTPCRTDHITMSLLAHAHLLMEALANAGSDVTTRAQQ